MNEKLNQLLTGLVNLKQPVLDVGIDGYQAVLYTNHTLEQEKEFSCKDYLKTVALCVPHIEDLTFGKRFWNCLHQREMEMADFHYTDEIPRVEIVNKNLKRLSLKEGRLGRAAVTNLSKMFPHVQHLCVSHPRENSFHVSPNNVEVFVGGFKNLKSLMLGEIDRVLDDTVSVVPSSLEALQLFGFLGGSGGLTSTMNICTMLSRTASSLKVLVISVPHLLNPNYYRDETAEKDRIISNICQTLKMLEKLEVFAIEPARTPRHNHPATIPTKNAEFYACVEGRKSLISVIGVDFPDRSTLPLNITFITVLHIHTLDAQTVQTKLLHRSPSNPEFWLSVKENSPQWHKAHGSDHFCINKSITQTDTLIHNFVKNETKMRSKHFVAKSLEI